MSQKVLEGWGVTQSDSGGNADRNLNPGFLNPDPGNFGYNF